MQIVEQAIKQSKSNNEIVRIEVGPSGLVCSGNGVSGEEVCEELAEACDGESGGPEVREFWGHVENEYGEECAWRVHVVAVQL